MRRHGPALVMMAFAFAALTVLVVPVLAQMPGAPFNEGGTQGPAGVAGATGATGPNDPGFESFGAAPQTVATIDAGTLDPTSGLVLVACTGGGTCYETMQETTAGASSNTAIRSTVCALKSNTGAVKFLNVANVFADESTGLAVGGLAPGECFDMVYRQEATDDGGTGTRNKKWSVTGKATAARAFSTLSIADGGVTISGSATAPSVVNKGTLDQQGIMSCTNSVTPSQGTLGDCYIQDGLTVGPLTGNNVMTLRIPSAANYTLMSFGNTTFVGQYGASYPGNVYTDKLVLETLGGRSVAVIADSAVQNADTLFDARSTTTLPRVGVKGGGLWADGITAQVVHLAADAGVDPTSSTIIVDCPDAGAGGANAACSMTIQETAVRNTGSGAAYSYVFTGGRVTVIVDPSSAKPVLFPNVTNVFYGPAFVTTTGLGPRDSFEMKYVDATDDFWDVISTTDIP